MALLEDVLALEVLGVEGVAGPVALGAGAVLLVPRVLPWVGRVLRPVAKEVFKLGIVAYDATQATFSEAYQAAGDLVAEARHEREQESTARRQVAGARHEREQASTARRPETAAPAGGTFTVEKDKAAFVEEKTAVTVEEKPAPAAVHSASRKKGE